MPKFKSTKDGHEVNVADDSPFLHLFQGDAWKPVAVRKPKPAADEQADNDESAED